MRLDFHHVDEVLALGSNRAGPAKSTVLPDGWVVLRNKGELRFELQSHTPGKVDYEYRLPVPGSVEVQETESRFEVVLVSGNAAKGYNPEDLLDRALLAAELKVRNWRPGDRFWPPHTKTAKKVKELLQERQVAGPERKLWPVVASETDVVWVRGFSAPSRLQPRSADDGAVLIREVRL
jgi:tRNA(Ile)-lysidine synthase